MFDCSTLKNQYDPKRIELVNICSGSRTNKEKIVAIEGYFKSQSHTYTPHWHWENEEKEDP